mgnify:CR=1 FL=1
MKNKKIYVSIEPGAQQAHYMNRALEHKVKMVWKVENYSLHEELLYHS